jgi:hypothetical protein
MKVNLDGKLRKASHENLFDRFQAHVPGLVATVKAAMRDSARHSELSREQILDRMNDIATAAGIRLNAGNASALGLATLDKWLNPADREHVPGILAINVFCAAVGDHSALAVQLLAHGLEILTPEDLFARDYGRACLREKEARKLKRQLESRL